MPGDPRTEALLEARRQAEAAGRRCRWINAGVLAVLGAAFAAATVTDCRVGVERATSAAIGLVVAEVPAGLAAVWASGWQRPAKVTITFVVLLVFPVLLLGWFFSGFCL